MMYRRNCIKKLTKIILCDGDCGILQRVIKRILAREKILKLLFPKYRDALVVLMGNNSKIPKKLVFALGDLKGKL